MERSLYIGRTEKSLEGEGRLLLGQHTIFQKRVRVGYHTFLKRADPKFQKGKAGRSRDEFLLRGPKMLRILSMQHQVVLRKTPCLDYMPEGRFEAFSSTK